MIFMENFAIEIYYYSCMTHHRMTALGPCPTAEAQSQLLNTLSYLHYARSVSDPL
jgi:hypothetical protein